MAITVETTSNGSKIYLGGVLPPPDNKHLEKHPSLVQLSIPEITQPVNVYHDIDIPYDAQYMQGHVKKAVNACTAYSTSKLMSFLRHLPNCPPYLYWKTEVTDGDPATTKASDCGTYLRSTFDVLRNSGMRLGLESNPDIPRPHTIWRKSYGLTRNEWINVQDPLPAMREVYYSGNICVAGITVTEGWLAPVSRVDPHDGTIKYWIRPYGKVLGLHAILVADFLESLQSPYRGSAVGAIAFDNSWDGYPARVFMDIPDFTQLLRMDYAELVYGTPR